MKSKSMIVAMTLMLLVMSPLMFGFLLWGSGSSWSGGSLGIRSANKVFVPSIFSGFGGASMRFSAGPLVHPTYHPIGTPITAFGAFRWNFFDP